MRNRGFQFVVGVVIAALPCRQAVWAEESNSLAAKSGSAALRVVSRRQTKERPDEYNAVYVEPTGKRLWWDGRVSDDNGRTWRSEATTPNLTAGLPQGFRRIPRNATLDPHTGKLIVMVGAIDVRGLDPKIEEPRIEQEVGTIRYLVSTDGAKTWAADEQLIEHGRTATEPFEGVQIGKNAYGIGDISDRPIVTKSGKVVFPFQVNVLGPNGSIWHSWRRKDTDAELAVLVAIGTWNGDRLSWELTQRFSVDTDRSPRGLMEPTMVEMPDGRLLMVMRGSNGRAIDPKFQIPSRKWFSVSRDEGRTWTEAEPWGYSDGELFYSPCAMSVLFKHSSGRVYWVGHITPENPRGNLPRWPLVIGEVDPKSLKLIRDSLVTLDTEKEEDQGRGRLDLYDMNLREDRETNEIVLVYYRGHLVKDVYEYEWVTARLVER